MRQSMRLPMRSLAGGVTTAVWLLSVPAANAAAAALEQVANVREDYQQRIEAAAPSDRQGIADEAKHALVKTITNHGLSIEEYTSILVVAQNDPVVREKILQRISPSAK